MSPQNWFRLMRIYLQCHKHYHSGAIFLLINEEAIRNMLVEADLFYSFSLPNTWAWWKTILIGCPLELIVPFATTFNYSFQNYHWWNSAQKTARQTTFLMENISLGPSWRHQLQGGVRYFKIPLVILDCNRLPLSCSPQIWVPVSKTLIGYTSVLQRKTCGAESQRPG